MLAYIGLGSNLNNPKQQIQNALIALNDAKDVKVVALSSLYQSPPIDGSKQPDYLNAICQVDTHLTALELLYVCQAIETKQHRVREGCLGMVNHIIHTYVECVFITFNDIAQ
jgi:2-amino-4-hydroxy-6-hydroxymethyldihydropteridine diphosphokinase